MENFLAIIKERGNSVPIVPVSILSSRLPEGGIRKGLEFRADLILLELDLTDMDGLEFVTLLKRWPKADKIPIVAMSIFSFLKTAALFGGCDDFLQKPVKMIELMAHLRRVLHPQPEKNFSFPVL